MEAITILGNISAPTPLGHCMDFSWKLEGKGYKTNKEASRLYGELLPCV